MREFCMGKKYKHITLSDRTLIQTQLQQGFSPAMIAESLGRHRSSITRELARNGWKPTPTIRSRLHPPKLSAARRTIQRHSV